MEKILGDKELYIYYIQINKLLFSGEHVWSIVCISSLALLSSSSINFLSELIKPQNFDYDLRNHESFAFIFSLPLSQHPDT